MTSKQGLAVTAAILAVSAAFVFGSKIGRYYEHEASAGESRTLSERDQKIMQVIIKKNPNATIKDFADFPRMLVEVADAHKLDYRYVMAIIDKESEWNPKAVSPAGAVGLMQLMPDTAMLVVKRANIEGFTPPTKGSLGSLGDPAMNVRIGAQYLRWKIDEFGLGPEHLRAYNRGDVQARANWPSDRYAEDIAMKFVQLAAVAGAPALAEAQPERDRVPEPAWRRP